MGIFGTVFKSSAESNWIQTVAGKGFFPFYRFYGPLRAYNDKTWKPVEVELVR
jgi:hypothetical protein